MLGCSSTLCPYYYVSERKQVLDWIAGALKQVVVTVEEAHELESTMSMAIGHLIEVALATNHDKRYCAAFHQQK